MKFTQAAAKEREREKKGKGLISLREMTLFIFSVRIIHLSVKFHASQVNQAIGGGVPG